MELAPLVVGLKVTEILPPEGLIEVISGAPGRLAQ
jgi:hypothetical protein